MTEFSVWAPERDGVRLWLADGVHDMARDDDGWWRVTVPGRDHGADYGFLLDDAAVPADPFGDIDDEPDQPDAGLLPDPRSPWQPYGVHGPSRTYHHGRFDWTDAGWRGRALPGAVIYELHLGTFTPEGTFDAAIAHLDHLVALGVDLVELLPVNAFNGEVGWGYDGVLWYAVHQPYGGPDGLKRFVDACHAKGLGVIMDVVYNHLGPAGGHIGEFAPYLLKSRNIWGPQVNLDGPDSDQVRRYIIDNACGWLRDYHLDGLRLDAVHALHDSRAVHLLEELADTVAALEAQERRPLSLIAESDLNDPRLVTPREAGGYGLHAQWTDDVHHALHAALTGERQGYYADFGSVAALAKALSAAHVVDGTYSRFRRRSHGRPVDRLTVPGHRFVVYAQDHDQIGNRATGDRLPAILSTGLLKVAATLIFTSPYTPMLFMGEEWAAGTPWQYFSSHPQPKLARAVVRGRRKEFAAHGWRGRVPDPQDPQTFQRSKLDWSELEQDPHRDMLAFHRELIALRRARPELTDPRLHAVQVSHGGDWLLVRRGGLVVAANLAATPTTLELPAVAARVLLATGEVTLDGAAVALPAESAAVVELSAAR
ncbi:MAG: malto-oligosyltrehalose trehalohydrolase [Micromonosporaceae bacterium]